MAYIPPSREHEKKLKETRLLLVCLFGGRLLLLIPICLLKGMETRNNLIFLALAFIFILPDFIRFCGNMYRKSAAPKGFSVTLKILPAALIAVYFAPFFIPVVLFINGSRIWTTQQEIKNL